MSRYFELDVELLDFKVPKVGFLVIKDPSSFLSPDRPTSLPCVISSNLIQLGLEEFVRQHSINAIQTFTKPADVHPLVFAQFCVYYYVELEKLKTSEANPSNVSEVGVGAGLSHPAANFMTPQNFANLKKKSKDTYLEGFMDTVTVGDKHKPLCIPANSGITVQSHTSKLPYYGQCMAKQAECSNLPLGVVVNRTFVKPSKSKLVPIVLMNTKMSTLTQTVMIIMPFHTVLFVMHSMNNCQVPKFQIL